ncbi:MAG: tetratricopeptide repeat protein [Planctomycetota bacterium]
MQQDRQETTPSRPSLAGLLVLLVLAAYSSVLPAGFVWDDDDHVAENVELRSLDGLRRIWLDPAASPQHYPLTFTTFWIEHQLWGDDARGYHATNVLLHAAAALLAWAALRRLRVPGAWAAAAVFALHPVHVESVAWISERKNVLSGCLYLAALLAYLRFAPPDEERPRRGVLAWLAAFLLFALALLAKTVTASLPAALLLVRWWKRGRVAWRDVGPLAPFAVLGIAFALHTAHVERAVVGAVGPEWDFTLAERALIAGRAPWFYLGKLLWPASLSFVYPRWELGAAWQWVFPAATLGLLFVLARERRRFGRAPLAAGLFYGGTLLPALGFTAVYPMRYSFVADHFQYLASLGPISLLAAAAAIVARHRGGPRLAAGLAGATLVALGAATWTRGLAFGSEIALWEDVLAKGPDSAMAHHNLAETLLRAGDVAGGERHEARVLELDPDHAGARTNLAVVRLDRGDLAAAEELLARALRDVPDFPPARVALGRLHMLRGRFDLAAGELRLARELDPESAWARVNLARALLATGRLDEAEAELRAAISLAPDRAEAYLDLGRAFIFRGDLEEAGRQIDLALARRPDWSLALYLRGRTHWDRGERAAAKDCFARAIAADPRALETNSDLRELWEAVGGG